jgi:hypothetical protein
MSTKHCTKKAAPSVAATDLATLAARAVERASAARQAFVELNEAEVQAVSGGALPKADPMTISVGSLIDRGGLAGLWINPNTIKPMLF